VSRPPPELGGAIGVDIGPDDATPGMWREDYGLGGRGEIPPDGIGIQLSRTSSVDRLAGSRVLEVAGTGCRGALGDFIDAERAQRVHALPWCR
jgi:hypothetical protein